MDVHSNDWPICGLEFVQRETGHRVQVLIGAPVMDTTGVWKCQTEVTHLDMGKPVAVMGSDPFQTLIQAMERFRLVLSAQTPKYDAISGPADVVFPRYIPTSYGLDVYGKLCALVDEETRGIEDELTRKRLRSEERDGET